MAFKLRRRKPAEQAMYLQGELAKMHQEKMAYATIVAYLIHERGGHLYIPEEDLKKMPSCSINKRFDQDMRGWDFKLEYVPTQPESTPPVEVA